MSAEENEELVTKKFIKFNAILFFIIIVLYFVSINLSTSQSKIKSQFILTQILPLLYFALFSFFFGAIFIIGDDDLRNFLSRYFDNHSLNIGIIAAYTGAAAVIMSIFIKDIIQKILGVKIQSSPAHDVFEFIIGRIILLLLVSKNNLIRLREIF